MAGDWTMSMLAERLERRGHPIVPARIGINVGCTTTMVERLEQRLIAAADRYGRRIAVVGWSRGGTLGKIAVLRRPECVAALITLASPNVDPLAVSRGVARQLRVLNWLHAAGARSVLSDDCLYGACAEVFSAELRKPFPADVPFTAFYSTRDGVVDWRACLDPDAELIESRTSHLGIGTDPRVIATIVERLAGIVPKAA